MAVDVRPVHQEQQRPGLECPPRGLLVPVQRGWRDPSLAEPVHQEREGLIRLRRVDGGRSARDQGSSRRLHGFGEIHGEAFIGLELAAVAAEMVTRADDHRVVGELRPGLRRTQVRRRQDVRAVVQELGVARERHRVQVTPIHGRLDRRAQELTGRDDVVIEGSDPAVGREFRRPDHVQAHHVVDAAVRLQVRDQLRVLVVRVVGQVDRRDPLAWVAGVPLADEGLQVPGVDLTGRERDRPDTGVGGPAACCGRAGAGRAASDQQGRASSGEAAAG